MEHDIIGDIHGHSDKLIGLLRKLGYVESNGAWRHATRQAIFVGDFIDRGPGQLQTLDIVRRMVDGGSALAVMGNHEFNAIAWYTEDPEHPGKHLRPRHGDVGVKNRIQHQAFLAEVESDPRRHREIIEWFYSLPLWLELPGLRVVHACWHQKSMDELRPSLSEGHRLTPDLVVKASRRGTLEYEAVEVILKGLEVELPPGRSFQDKDGNSRTAVRTRWWDTHASTYRLAAVTSSSDHDWLPEDALPPEAIVGLQGDKPVIFGHYWMRSPMGVLSDLAACVDYSAGKGGPLVAYRWEGEKALSNAHFFAF